MKINGIKREWSYPLFCRKAHYCPNCSEKLKKTKKETVVNSESPDAKNYDFSTADGYMVGNIKFIKTIFRCSKCNKTFTIQEIKEYER